MVKSIRMKKHIYIILFIVTLLSGKSFNNIEFTGDVDLLSGEFDRTTLLKVCHIEYPAIYKIWKKNPTFKESQIEEFVSYLLDYSKSMGYYRAKVDGKTDGDTIYLNIKKNTPIKIHSISIDEEYRKFLELQKNRRFRTIDFTNSKKKIETFLEESGYPTFKMDAKAYVDLDLYRVDVNISVNRGVKRFFASTEVNNSSKIDENLIKDKITYKEGELYNILKLEESYENIYQLGVFETIQMEPDFNSSSGKTPINITLKEGKTKEFASHLGYDTQDGARGGVEYIDHNFLGNLRELKVKFHISQRGYEWFNSFYQPRFEVPLVGDISFKNELSYSKWDYDAYVEKLFTERVTFGKKLIGLEHYFGFQHERSKIESGIPTFLAGNYVINSLFYRVLVDARDNPLDAKNGYYTSLYMEKSMKSLGSDIDYFKLLAEARYIKEFKNMVFAVKLKAGTISQETPPFKHFFIGGAMSNRGYEYRDLGEHFSGYPIGGLSMLDGSFESRYYLTDLFSVVGFIDSSKLSQRVDDFSQEWYTSYGLGLRYLSIIGPLRLDVGFPTTGGFALHLGIGQVF